MVLLCLEAGGLCFDVGKKAGDIHQALSTRCELVALDGTRENQRFIAIRFIGQNGGIQSGSAESANWTPLTAFREAQPFWADD